VKRKITAVEEVKRACEFEAERVRNILADFLSETEVCAAQAEYDEQLVKTAFAAFQLKLPSSSLDNLSSIILIQILARRLKLDLKLGPADIQNIAEQAVSFILGRT